MNKNLIWGVVVLAFFVLVIFFFRGGSSTGAVIDEDSEEISLSPLNPSYYVVEISSRGFSPEILEVEQGDIVTWVNLDSKRHWPASDSHPIHDVYPDFDSKKPLMANEEWEFHFDKVGEWEYHDHLNPSKVGKIIVR